jgi:hypothetical protein
MKARTKKDLLFAPKILKGLLMIRYKKIKNKDKAKL